MTRKKQQKNKKQNPGVFISNLLNSGKSGQQQSEQELTKSNPNSEANDGKNSLVTFQSAVLCRTVLELALVNLALGPGHQPCQQCKNISERKNICLCKKMAPPAASTSSGLSKLMSPVQDLGKSLLGFLIGSPTVVNQSSSQEAGRQLSSNQDPAPPSRRTSSINYGDTLERKRDSLTLPTSPGRQRPPGRDEHVLVLFSLLCD